MDEEDNLEKYLLTVHKTNILQILLDADIKKHYSVNINFVELYETNTSLGNRILKYPEEAFQELDNWLVYIQELIMEESSDSENYIKKENVHARVYALPPCPELHRIIFPKNEDVDLFLQITGTVVRVASAKMLQYRRNYKCTKCKQVEHVQAIYNQNYIIVPPKKCSNVENCSGTNFIASEELHAGDCKDYQEIKIQEQASKLGVGIMPSFMWVSLEDDLVDMCKPGDDVTICGSVKRRWSSLGIGKRIEVNLALKANHIQINNGQSFSNMVTPEMQDYFINFWKNYQDDPIHGRDIILKSFCPKLYGMYLVKLATALILAGGSRCKEGNNVGIQLRSEPHLLLVGDPGTGKSQLLQFAAKVISRSVITTGVGTTSAGLTVAAILEEGQWQLEGGALVLADGGICCIDEFNSMKPHDRTSIHEAMEQQTISVAKASIVCKLNTRCSILAATNPKCGHLDPSQPLSLNLTLPSPLLSRFDLILMLQDCYDPKWDNYVADYILSNKNVSKKETHLNLWTLEMLQQYFIAIKKLNPALTSTSNTILSAYYQLQRHVELRNKARTTARLLDSLVRLSQAHARLMFHTDVEVMDAIYAIILIESSMHGECSVFSLKNLNVLESFTDNPAREYYSVAKLVLTQLRLHSILKNELLKLNKNYNDIFVNGESLQQNISTENESTTDIDDSVNSKYLNNSIIRNSKETCQKAKINLDILKTFQKEKITLPEKSNKSIKNNKKDEPKINQDVKCITKKRKREDTKVQQCKISKMEINMQIFNKIPSVNDDFDDEILNYCHNSAQEIENNENIDSIKMCENKINCPEEVPMEMVDSKNVTNKDQVTLSASKDNKIISIREKLKQFKKNSKIENTEKIITNNDVIDNNKQLVLTVGNSTVQEESKFLNDYKITNPVVSNFDYGKKKENILNSEVKSTQTKSNLSMFDNEEIDDLNLDF